MFEHIPSMTHVPRRQALDVLQRAHLMPDRFTAHRNGTFTARYLRDEALLKTPADHFESQLDSADRRVAILKRPSPKLDRGRWVTLQFTFATFSA